MLTNVLYSTSATATGGGRDGHTQVDDGSADFDLTVPKELGGASDQGMNPEKLFAMGYSSCFMGALHHFAASQKVKVPASTSVKVSVGIGPREDNGFGLDVQIIVAMPGMDRAQAEALIKGAHHVCPYSHATSNTLAIEPVLA
ncbi:organic hydroperoxide resistance protein [Paracoccus sp. R86501]|uniref:organic hydroperoxide resistance protein n=1 Tax=Paracoccus sp. R86501 TaxID=3101711 RepID=UPI00366F4F0D